MRMKKSLPLLLLSSLLIGLSSFGQEIDLEFSKTVQNAGDPTLPTTAKGTLNYGPDRKNGTNCALKLDYDNAVSQGGYVKLTNANTLDFTSPFSISIWFRTYNNGPEQYLFTKGLYSWPANEDFSIRIGQGGLTGTALPDYMSATASAPTKWYHYVMVHDGDSISVYLDNVLKVRRDLKVTTTNSDTAMIGYHFAGNIDQFHFYSYDLSRNQVNSLYIAATKCPNVITGLVDFDTSSQGIIATREGEEILINNTLSHDLAFQMVDLQGKVLQDGTLGANTLSRHPLSTTTLVLLNATDGVKRYRKKL